MAQTLGFGVVEETGEFSRVPEHLRRAAHKAGVLLLVHFGMSLCGIRYGIKNTHVDYCCFFVDPPLDGL